ncbi:MAG: deoxyribose-phosphate aldolase [Planctomycetota bacterium]|nr:deoxyribose-phosphate aldolase [Planctomycetota bacterium]
MSAGSAGDPITTARRALACLDLTLLGADVGPGDAVAVCERALTPNGPTAAVCVWPRFLPLAKATLAGAPVNVATVANFPEGHAAPDRAAAGCAEASAYGADEVDLVFPFEAWHRGDERQAVDLVRICRAALGRRIVLKVILETGTFEDPDALRRAAHACVHAGADFLKTSTGTREPGATVEAATTLLEAAQEIGPQVGVKVSGGIATLADAGRYLELAEQIRGPEGSDPSRFRIGASRLLDPLLAALAGA